MRAHRPESGFSLVEMLLVVSIIGLLAALAVPTWSRMMAKSRQTEAKTNLASVASLEHGFHQEYARFGDFSEINFSVDGDARYLYCLGSWTGGGAGGGGVGGISPMSVPPAGGGGGGGGVGGTPNTPGGTGGSGSTVGGGGSKGGVGGVQIQSVPPAGGSAIFARIDRELLRATRGGHELLAILLPPALPAMAPPSSGSLCGGNAHFDESSFEADAAGQISDAPAPNDVDVWSIDQATNIVNLNRGY